MRTKVAAKPKHIHRRTSPHLGRRMANNRDVPWWLGADIEVCSFCFLGYAYGTGFRCISCDVAVCSDCKEIRVEAIFCPEC